MARIENTTEHPFDVTGLPRTDATGNKVFGSTYHIPRGSVAPDGTKTNGVGEIPDDVLAELLDKDQWTKGIFAAGELVQVGAVSVAKGSSSAPLASDSDGPVKAKK